jgi:O-antigen/teichoic acid export membrane protein
VARGDYGAVRVQLRKILAVTTGAGVAGAAVFTLLGAWALRVFFGQTTTPSTGILGLLALGTVVLMVATVAQPALVAVDEDIAIMTGWSMGALATGVIAALPFAAISAAAAGQLAGPALTALILGFALWKALRQGPATAPVEPAAISEAAGSRG